MSIAVLYGPIRVLQQCMVALAQGRVEVAQLHAQVLTVIKTVEDFSDKELLNTDAPSLLRQLHKTLWRIEGWCKERSQRMPDPAWKVWARGVIGSSDARIMQRLRDDLEDILSKTQTQRLELRDRTSNSLQVTFMEERIIIQRRHHDVQRIRRGLPLESRALYSVSTPPDGGKREDEVALVPPARHTYNDTTWRPYETVTIYRSLGIVLKRDPTTRTARVVLESTTLREEDFVTLADPAWLSAKTRVRETSNETKAYIQKGYYVLENPSEQEIESFGVASMPTPRQWGLSCIRSGAIIDLVVNSELPATISSWFPPNYDRTMWVRLSFGEEKRHQAKEWYQFLYNLYNNPSQQAPPPPSLHLTVVTRTPGIATLIGGEVFIRPFAGRGMRGMHRPLMEGSPEHGMNASSTSPMMYKRFFGTLVSNIATTASGAVQCEWTDLPELRTSSFHRQADHTMTRIKCVASEVIHQVYNGHGTNRREVDLEQRDLYDARQTAIDYFNYEVLELVQRRRERGGYGTTSLSNMELPSPPLRHELYLSPHGLYQMMKGSRQREWLVIDLRPDEDHEAAHMIGDTINIDPEVLLEFDEFKPHSAEDRHSSIPVHELLRQSEVLCFNMLQAIRKFLAPNRRALWLFDARASFKHIVISDQASLRFPPYAEDRRSHYRSREHPAEFALNNIYGALYDGLWKGALQPGVPQLSMSKPPYLLVGGWEAWKRDIGSKGIAVGGIA